VGDRRRAGAVVCEVMIHRTVSLYWHLHCVVFAEKVHQSRDQYQSYHYTASRYLSEPLVRFTLYRSFHRFVVLHDTTPMPT
jgi:hypothetical protein